MVVVAVAMAADGVHFVEKEQSCRPEARLADSRVAVPEKDPTPRVSFQHPQRRDMSYSGTPRNCQRDSAIKNCDHIYK